MSDHVRSFAFGAYNSNRYSKESFLVVRAVVCKPADPDKEWNQEMLRTLRQSRDVNAMLKRWPSKLLVPDHVRVAVDKDDRFVAVKLGSGRPEKQLSLEKLALGTLSNDEAQPRVKEGKVLFEGALRGLPYQQTNSFELPPGYIRPVILTVKNDEEHAVNILSVEHWAVMAPHRPHEPVGKLTLFFPFLHDACH